MDPHLELILSLLADSGTGTMARIGVLPFFVLLGAALAGSLIAARLYVQALGERATGSGLHRTFPLLGVSLAALFVVFQFSLPLGLGLLAALTLARFRTPVKEPEEIGFIMLVVAVAVASASFRLGFAGLLLFAAAGALLVRLPAPQTQGAGEIVIALPDPPAPDPASRVAGIVGATLPRGHLASLSWQDGRTVLTYSFRDTAPATLHALESAVRAAAPQSAMAVFPGRPDLQ